MAIFDEEDSDAGFVLSVHSDSSIESDDELPDEQYNTPHWLRVPTGLPSLKGKNVRRFDAVDVSEDEAN
ncbi:hypothetical protein FBU30_001641, partial [Linnemannia zychae]